MGIYTTLFTGFVAFAVTTFLLIFAYFKQSYKHWKKHGVAHVEPTFPFGNFLSIVFQTKNVSIVIGDLYKDLKKSGQRFFGMYNFTEPIVVPIDPELIRNILASDFQHFTSRGIYFNEKDDPLSAHLLSVNGIKWRNLRSKISPTFTSGKMKMMFPTLVAVTEKLVEVINEKAICNQPIDMRETMASFTTDIIGSCAFGLETNSLQEPNNELRQCGRRFFEITTLNDTLRSSMFSLFPNMMKRLKIKLAPPEVDSFFNTIIKGVVAHREETNVERKDFMYLLLQLKKQGRLLDDNTNYIKNKESEPGAKLSLDEIAAQCFIFFLAGFETSSTTSNYIFYELAKNPDIQERLRREINSVLESNNGEFTYDGLMSMTYLDRVVSETLRKYPVAPLITRECSKDYQIPGSNYKMVIGERVFIPVVGLHHDPQYYPNPEKFDPERFNEENVSKIPQYAYLPFGEGPRFCIGKRFGLMQSKLGVATVLKNFRLTLNPKTIEPLDVNPKIPLHSPKHVVYMNAVKI